MAFTASNLHLVSGGAPGNLVFNYDAESDTMATVAASGYMNNTDDTINLTVDDVIFASCSDGTVWLQVSALSSGAVTTQVLSSEGPYNGDVGAADATLSVGVSEIGSGTGTTFTLPTPYAGAVVTAVYTASATDTTELVTSAAGVTINNQGDRTISLAAEGAWAKLLGVSATRWVIAGHSGAAFS